ncbi:hypothetical protein [Qipengyuania atrilutea]|uniref:Uncharacterized protein n=1 Tax=Qipengyuania atrilutea TaxID=2744473 RepID=A0A850GXU1_9SPHN|nr:hypothetical protein [Actirhodobacter atriluteus]NVD44391.1 hypothetical protein [Actirhodobacter atriluteus]
MFVAALFSILLASCNDRASELTGDPPADKRKEFSDAEKQIAAELSIGNQAILEEATSDYEQALVCDMALESLATQLTERGALNAAQRQAFVDARKLFVRRQKLFAGQRNGEDIASDRREFEIYAGEDSVRAQIAIGCIRKLQEEQS